MPLLQCRIIISLCLVVCAVFFVVSSLPIPHEDNSCDDNNPAKKCDNIVYNDGRQENAQDSDNKLVIDEPLDVPDEIIDEDDESGEEGDLFEGDIDLGDDEHISETADANGTFKNLVLLQSLTWPNKKVYYSFSSEFDYEEKKIVDDAIEDLHNFTCVRFIPRVDEVTYLYFRNKKKSCSAPVGWNPKRGRVDVSLGGRNCLARRGTVQHELLHALGFWHEHSRTDRDSNIIILWDNIADGREKNFKVRMANESTTLGIPYDFDSVMHYRNNSFSKDKKRKATIIPRNPFIRVVMGQRNRVSASDIAKVNRLYRCDKSKYDMGNGIPGAIFWDSFKETVLNEKPVYFNKLPEPEPLEFEENQFKLSMSVGNITKTQ